MSIRVAALGEPPWRCLALPGDAAGGRWAGFGLAHLPPGGTAALPVGARTPLECVVVPLRGRLAVSGPWGELALRGRADVWEAAPDVAYLPPKVTAHGIGLHAGPAGADVAMGLAPAGDSLPASGGATRVDAAAITVETRGAGATERLVRHLYGADRPAVRLLVVEVLTPPGHWSSFPPHRHDGPEGLEEFYYCEVRPRTRLAYLHAFADPPGPDEAVAVQDGGLFLVREGYHTAASPPGTSLYYLNVMAGPVRRWAPQFHPAYRDLVVGWERAPVARS